MARTTRGSVMLLLAGLVSACSGVAVQPPTRADLAAELIRTNGGKTAPKQPEGACWDKDTTPAVIETVTKQTVLATETRDAAGKVKTPASFRSETAQNILQDRQEVWFRTPCPDQMDTALYASLQRSLKARGYYRGAVTGTYNAATAKALRRFQAVRGFDSSKLTLAAAREMGLIAADLDRF